MDPNTPPQGRPGANNPAPLPPPPAPPPAPAAVSPVANTTSAFAPAPHQTGAGHVDFDKLVLPKKQGAPSVDSAQRINAGLLFEQERAAGAEGLVTVGGLPSDGAATSGDLPAGKSPYPEGTSPSAPAPKQEQPLVKPLQTYQSDVESLVQTQNVSVVGIAAAEADKRAEKPLEPTLPPGYASKGHRGLWLSLAAIVLLTLTVGGGAYIYVRLQPVPASVALPAPFILVDDTATIEVTGNDGRSAVMSKLTGARDSLGLSLGLVGRLQLVKKTALGDALQEVGAPEFLQLIAPRVPPELVRTLEPQMLIGVHNYAALEPFMILKADSFETAYSGMLAWESTMQADLYPLFSRVPPVHAKPKAAAPVATQAATSTASSTSPLGAQASTTSGTASSTPALRAPRFSQGNFIDQIVGNRDARAVLNEDGDILLLWTMLDRSTIVITTNESTLREVISRLSQASVISLPAGQ